MSPEIAGAAPGMRRRRGAALLLVLAVVGGAAVKIGVAHRSSAAAVPGATDATAGATSAAEPVAVTETPAKIVVRLGHIPRAVPGRPMWSRSDRPPVAASR